jgi:hypothetical protein
MQDEINSIEENQT